MKRHWVATFMTALIALATPAHAIIVFDPSNLVQNSLTAARSLQEINNQLRQLENEATMLINEARNLTTLPFNILAQLQATLASTTRLITQAQGVAYQLNRAQAQFARFYPQSYDGNASAASMAADAYQRWLHSLQALQTTVSMQAQAAQNLASDQDALAQLVSQSQGAIGILQAAQSTNQLLALHARQLIQDQQLRVTQERSAALERARNVAAEARAREVRRRFLGSGPQYTFEWVDFYGF